ncbi:MAG: ribosome recycling factor [Candidatus Hydrogenedentota bacterium]
MASTEWEGEAQEKMEKALEALRHEFSAIRTGRASVSLLDMVDVEVYGAKMKVNQLATVTTPEPRLLMVTPWDKSQIGVIEKAIIASPLDLTPSNDGKAIRIPIPQPTEERRKELVKMVKKLAEETRVSIRNARRQAIDAVKKAQKAGDIPEDDAHREQERLQELTDQYIEKVDETLKHKEEEIMEV